LQKATEIVSIIKKVAYTKAKKRIPEELEGLSFFGHWDVWLYHAVMDDRTCELCQHYAEREPISGDHLRTAFPYLEIMDENTILVNVHPNCRCWLERA